MWGGEAREEGFVGKEKEGKKLAVFENQPGIRTTVLPDELVVQLLDSDDMLNRVMPVETRIHP